MVPIVNNPSIKAVVLSCLTLLIIFLDILLACLYNLVFYFIYLFL
jgi:hypothetical protein